VTDSSTPVAVLDLVGVSQLDAGDGHTCALLGTGQVACWGDNDSAQLGDSSMVDSARPVVVDGLSDVLEVEVGGFHSCARQSGARAALCWGANPFGQLGNGTMTTTGIPTVVMGLQPTAIIGIGFQFSCAIEQPGDVLCWGNNEFGQVGDGTTTTRTTPVMVTGP
jgi:alpha-tubulin suppressor-like RCC1 family protein